MVNVTLKYGSNTLVVACLQVHGLYDVDALRTWPGIDQTDLAGGRRQLINSLARKITLVTDVLSVKADHVFIGVGFNLSNAKQLVYGSETIDVVWADGTNPVTSEWVGNYEYAKRYTLQFDEKTTWTSAPSSFS